MTALGWIAAYLAWFLVSRTLGAIILTLDGSNLFGTEPGPPPALLLAPVLFEMITAIVVPCAIAWYAIVLPATLGQRVGHRIGKEKAARKAHKLAAEADKSGALSL